MNEAATKKYYQTIIAIDKEIELLKDQIAEYDQTWYDQTCKEINWTNVGDMKYILSQLKQLNERE